MSLSSDAAIRPPFLGHGCLLRVFLRKIAKEYREGKYLPIQDRSP